MNLGVDIDAVLCDNIGPTTERLNAMLGTSFTVADLTKQFAIEPVLEGIHPDPSALLAEIFDDGPWIYEHPLILPTKVVLTKIAQHFDQIHIVTSRRPAVESLTRAWLNRYGIRFQKLACVKDKAAYCLANDIRYMIEDAPHHVEALLAAGIRVFMVEYPYNAHVPSQEGLWRVTNQMEIEHLLKADLRKRTSSPSSAVSAPAPSVLAGSGSGSTAP